MISLIFSFIISTCYTSSHQEEYWSEISNEQLEELKSLQIKNVVKQKFIDSNNHSFCIVIFSNESRFNLINTDTFDFYNYILPNDSIVKVKGSDTVTVFRGTNIKKFRLERGIIE